MYKAKRIAGFLFILVVATLSTSLILIYARANSEMSLPTSSGSNIEIRKTIDETDDVPEPLPHDCDGVAPPDDPDTCCVYGYVYYNGEPVAGVYVQVESASGVIFATTTSGEASGDPYYSSSLSVTAGARITITASYSDMVSARTWTVQDGGQQVDLGLVAGYQVPVPISALTADAPDLETLQDSDWWAVVQGDSHHSEYRAISWDQTYLPDLPAAYYLRYNDLYAYNTINRSLQVQGSLTSKRQAVRITHRADSSGGVPFGAESIIIGAADGTHSAYAMAMDGDAAVAADSCYARVTSTPGITYTNVQAAVDAANDGDVVKVAGYCAGVEARDGVTQTVYINKSITLRGGYTSTNWTVSDPVANPTTLDAQGQGRVIYITGDISPTVEGLRITGGYVKASGGGIYNKNADLALINSTITNNISSGTDWTNGLGGGVYVETGSVTLSGGQVVSNSASYKGGGICVWGGSATLNGVQIIYNIANGPTYWDGGGGLWVLGSATISGAQIINNTANFGGGLYVYFSDVTLSEVRIIDNSAAWTGGGVFIWNSDVALNRGTILNNSARSGGGMFIWTGPGVTLNRGEITNNSVRNGGEVHSGGIFTLTNSVVAGNWADGLHISGVSSRLLHTTIGRNSDGSGVYITNSETSSSTVNITNTILVSHTTGVCVTPGNTVTLEATLWGADAWANETDWGCGGTVITGSVNIWGDPAFVAPDTEDYHISLGSAAINAGVDAGVPDDMDGDSRTDGYPDIGADELQYAAPNADFIASPLSGTVPLTVTFTDLSTGDIISWDWTFGDGGVSGARHPEYIYTDPDTYTVSLTVSGPGGYDTEIKIGYITALPDGIPTCEIVYISPNPVTQHPTQTLYFNGQCRDNDADEGGAYIVTHRWRSDIDGFLNSAEDFSIPATEISSGTHIISLQGQDDEGEWSPEVTTTLTVYPPPTDTVRTLILVNRQKLESLYGVSEAISVVNKLNELAAHDNVKGLVVQVEKDAAVAAAYTAWDSASTDTITNTIKAIEVAKAIKALVDTKWAAYPDLKYLIIVGDDRVIPFRRVPDQTRFPERYYHLVSKGSTVGAALRDNMTLTDDYYADAEPVVPRDAGWDGHELYIPDLGIGRLIETPGEIVAQIDTFLGDDGVVASDAIVTGYVFVKDGAQAMCDRLSEDGLTTDCTLIGDNWGREEFIERVLNTRHEIISINGHAHHYVIGTPSGYVSSSDIASAVANYVRTIFYSLGCHAGLNVPPSNLYESLDIAQVLAQKQANYVAPTGYSWGYLTSIGLSERLMLDFTERLVYGQSATLGQALTAAKQEYYLKDRFFSYYDEKIMIESTLYGLPMYRYTTPAGVQNRQRATTAIQETQFAELGNGLTVNSYSFQFPALLPESTGDGDYYTFGGLTGAGEEMPIQPKYTLDVSFPGTKAHGAVFKGGTYTDVLSFNPVVEQAITETTTLTEPGFGAADWYPLVLHRLSRLERGERLVTLLGQFNALSQTERLYDRLSFDVYYHTDSDDWNAPIVGVCSELEGYATTVTVNASDPSGVEAVVVAYTNGDGTWASVDLAPGENLWVGSFPAKSDTEFFIQAVDKAGNVALWSNDGVYFNPGECFAYDVFLPIVAGGD